MELRHLLLLVRKWLLLIILACLIGGAAGLAVDHFQPKKYGATATLFVSSLNGSDYNTLLGDQQAAKALALFPQSNSVLVATLKAVGNENISASQLASMVTTQNDLDSQFVTIQVRASNPQLAALLASQIAKQSIAQFDATVTDSNIAQTLRTQITSLDAQIKSKQQKIATIESQVVNGSPTQNQTKEINDLTQSVDGLQQLYAQYVNAYGNRTNIQVTLLQDAQVPQNPVGSGPLLAVVIGMLVGLIAMVGVIIFIEQTDDVLRTPAKVNKASGLSTLITVKYLPALARKTLLLNSPHRSTKNTDEHQPLPVMATQAAWLDDIREVAEATDPRLKAISMSMPVVVVKPVADVKVGASNGFHSSELEASNEVGASNGASNGFHSSKVKVEASNEFQLPEAFTTLAVFLRGEHSQIASDGNTIGSLLITSPEDGDGKTLIASQIALGLARVGVEVVLVDANLHQPKVHSLFGLSNRRGLSSLLSTSQIDDDSTSPMDDINNTAVDYTFTALQKTSQINLSILPAGPAIDSSTEMLSSPGMKAIINQLSKDAFVVIDGPAVLTSSESVILANKSEAVLMVVNASHTTTAKLNRSLEMLAWVHTDILGVVLNQVGNLN